MMQQAPCLEQSHGDVDTGGDNGHHAHQLDQDIQRGAGRILEGVAHRVADDGGLVAFRALAAHMALLNVLLGVVPRAAGIRHEHGQNKAGGQPAGQQAEHAGNAEHQPMQMGVITASTDGQIISCWAPAVEISTQRT